MKKILYNASMPRSGSELFQAILSQNPSIYASVTSPLLEYQFGARVNYNLPEVKSQDPELMQKAFISMCGSMAQSYYDAITNRPIVIDKNRGWTHYYEWVDQWNPNPKMVCLVRDLRSIIGSMERIYRKNRHSPEGPDNPAALKNMTVAARANHWLSTAPVGLALERNLDIFQRGIHEKILFIRYEDLLTDPHGVMETFYNYIEEDKFAHDFNKIKKNVKEDSSFFGIFGNHDVQLKLGKYKESDWSEMLPPPLATEIVRSYRWYFENFKYL
jgi:sulfotransferase